MDMFALVRPEFLNHFGNLFGGQLLKWVDEFAWLTATHDFPGAALVTRALDRVEFTEPVRNGAILRFHIRQERLGTTSVTYAVTAFAQPAGERQEQAVFETAVTFVSVGANGTKSALPLPHDSGTDTAAP